MHPTSNPTIILIFFMNGEPKISVKIMETKDRNPRPMNWGDPHGAAWGAPTLGHRDKGPDVGLAWQPFDPPPQSNMPDEPTREAPIIRTTVPIEASDPATNIMF
jgi:hypothetical protein